MKTKNNFIKPALVVGIVAVFACAATAQADDSKASSSGDDNASQKSASSQAGDNASQNSENAKASSSDSSKVNSDNSKSSDDNAQGDNQNSGGVVSPVQSKADPYGLKVAGPVMVSGSDASSKSFNQSVLPSLDAFIRGNLPDGRNNLKSGVFEINPDKIVLASKTAVRAYFVSESGGYASSIGVDATKEGQEPTTWQKEISSSASKLIFPSANSVDDFIVNGPSQVRTASQPVLPGDFVNLGTFAAGTKLDFFMIANGANQSGAPVYSAKESLNPDGFQQHVAGFTSRIFAAPQLNSPYLFLAFKDMWGGGDKDMNDVIIALNVGTATVKALLATPEPTTWLTLGSFLGVAIWAKRRSDRQAAVLA
ncbi:MAG: DUF4114 domain-containing protein [Verrucomicrobiota bacterium]